MMANLEEEGFRRIVAALWFRVNRVFRAPEVVEFEFLRLTGNHCEFREKLRQLGQVAASNNLERNIFHVGFCWMRLALDHLEDARSCLATNRRRSTFSRSYYAAYNASKSVRYLVTGSVSLKGDDHQKSSDLPDDFPMVEKWSTAIVSLYEHRLLADYDNWDSTGAEFSLSPAQAFQLAEEFVDRARGYLSGRIGVQI